jgi:hypothetical protein
VTDPKAPDLEIDLLCHTVDLAFRHAERGQPAHGYLELLYGRERARTAGEPWALELRQRWTGARTAYASR